MRRTLTRLPAVLAAVAAALSLVALVPAPASAQRDKDCADFSSQRAAQIFFLKHGGPRYDPDHLDGDHDGVACEDNPAPYYFGERLP
jgi:hypothetical protein